MRPRGAPFLSIVLPAWNEEIQIEPAISAIVSRMVACGFPYEILVVDDGSTDGTAEVARVVARRFDAYACAGDLSAWAELRVISYASNRGKGHAVRTGVLESRGRFVAFMDVDLSTPPAYLPAFLVEAASGWDVVAASRRLPASRSDPPQGLVRRLGGRIFAALARRLLRLPPATTDVTCGFKVFRGAVARALFARQRLEGWGFDAEILFLAHRASLKVKELPVTWANRADSRVRLIRDTIASLADLAAVRRNDAAGRYGPADLPVAAPGCAAEISGVGGLAVDLDQPAEAGAGVGGRDLRDLLGRS